MSLINSQVKQWLLEYSLGKTRLEELLAKLFVLKNASKTFVLREYDIIQWSAALQLFYPVVWLRLGHGDLWQKNVCDEQVDLEACVGMEAHSLFTVKLHYTYLA